MHPYIKFTPELAKYQFRSMRRLTPRYSVHIFFSFPHSFSFLPSFFLSVRPSSVFSSLFGLNVRKFIDYRRRRRRRRTLPLPLGLPSHPQSFPPQFRSLIIINTAGLAQFPSIPSIASHLKMEIEGKGGSLIIIILSIPSNPFPPLTNFSRQKNWLANGHSKTGPHPLALFFSRQKLAMVNGHPAQFGVRGAREISPPISLVCFGCASLTAVGWAAGGDKTQRVVWVRTEKKGKFEVIE
jgi:hypothetical protein